MSTFGVLSTGFNKKTESDILDEIKQSIFDDISVNLNTEATAILGQFIGVFANQHSQDWDVLEDVYDNQYPDSATGASLDSVASITGATRLAATESTVTLLCTGTDGTILPIARQARVPSGGTFETLAAATITLGTLWAPAVAFSVGDIRVNDTPDRVYVATTGGTSAVDAATSSSTETFVLVDGQTLTVKVDGAAAQTVTFNTGDFADIGAATAAEVAAVITTDLSSPAATGGTSAGAVTITSDSGGQIEVTGGTANAILNFPTTIFGGPIGIGTTITDGTVVWRFLGAGDGFITVAAEATVTGPTVGLGFTITEIVTAVSGWDGVTNQLDAAAGRDIETDSSFRTRRVTLLSVSGKSTIDAIRAAVLLVTNVNQAFVFENTTLITDGTGLPGKAFEVVVQGGTDVAVAQAIFDNKPAGIRAFGDDISELIADTAGNSHTIEASRADPVEMFIDVTVLTDANFPSDGATQIENALLTEGATLIIGEDVVFVRFQCIPLDISGVVDVTVFELDKRPAVVTSANAETYILVDGQTLTVKVDGESVAQTATFNTADFADIANATAAEVAAVITTDITGATGADAATFVSITSDSTGTIEVTGGTANAALGFPTTFDPTGTANVTILSRQLATFDSTRITVTVV